MANHLFSSGICTTKRYGRLYARRTPSFAELMFLIDLARILNGWRLMRFLNPYIYQNPTFTDIVKVSTCASARGRRRKFLRCVCERARCAVQGTNSISRGGGPLPYGYNCVDKMLAVLDLRLSVMPNNL